MCSQVDAADAEVVSGADEAGLQFQSSGVGLDSLLATVSVGQSCPQPVPQQIVLRVKASLLVNCKEDTFYIYIQCTSVINPWCHNHANQTFTFTVACIRIRKNGGGSISLHLWVASVTNSLLCIGIGFYL